jgi:hypothetical protein
MSEEAFVESMNVHLQELESIAEDVEDIANEFSSYVMQQATLNKAARIHDVIGAIRYDVKKFDAHA